MINAKELLEKLDWRPGLILESDKWKHPRVAERLDEFSGAVRLRTPWAGGSSRCWVNSFPPDTRRQQEVSP